MKMRCMAQFGADAEDLREFLPELEGYLNSAYNLMSWYADKKRVGNRENERPRLAEDSDIPDVPEWTHEYMCDYATYLIYRNGNQARQQRGIPFLQRWNEGVTLAAQNTADGIPDKFRNLYVYEPNEPPKAEEWRERMAAGGIRFDPLGE
jgi:hypothetical protein